MIYCVGGVSGTGKSTLIHNHPQLKELKHIDIAQAYQEAEERDARISWQEALEWLIDAAARQLLIARQRSIVLEAFFRPGKEQRERYEVGVSGCMEDAGVKCRESISAYKLVQCKHRQCSLWPCGQ